MLLMLQFFMKHPQVLTGDGAALWNPRRGGYERIEDPRKHYAEIADLMQKAHVFVIELPPQKLIGGGPRPKIIAVNPRGEELPGTGAGIEVPGAMRPNLSPEHPVAPPFSVCWFETVQDNGNVPVTFIEEPPLSKMASKRETWFAPIGCLMHEKAPGLYDLFVLEISGKRTNPEVPQIAGEPDRMTVYHSGVCVYRDVSDLGFAPGEPPTVTLIARWLERLDSAARFVEETEQTVVIRRPDRLHKRKPVAIRRIVRILPKHRIGKAPPITPSGRIDWSHRWEVRGHWRKIDANSIGKDRAGEYIVRGFTWIVDFVKGPDDAPLVKKTRVLIEAKEPS